MPTYNGVGAYWMPQWLRDAVTAWFLRDFPEGIAQDHDLAYWLHVRPRAGIDRDMLDAMLAVATGLRTRIKAWLIYAMVRLLGGPSYTRNNPRT